jgi:hypothetical protein
MKRELTDAQAMRGEQPQPLTRAEWQAMHDASLMAESDAMDRTGDAMRHAYKRREAGADERQQALESCPLTAADHIAALVAMGAQHSPDNDAFTDWPMLILPPEMTP